MADSTRSTVRLTVAALLGDNIDGTATSATTTTLVNTGDLTNYADSVLIGSYVHIYNGTNGVGQERLVTANTQSTGTLTVATWTQPTGTILYEVHRQWRKDDYNTAINQAINDLRGDNGALVEAVVDTSISLVNTGASTDYIYDLSAVSPLPRYVYNIWMESSTSGIYDDLILPGYYRIEKKTEASATAASKHQLVFNRNLWGPTSGRKLRIEFAGFTDELTNDNTLTLPEHLLPFVTHQAMFYLLDPEGGLGTPGAAHDDKRALRHYQLAEGMRGRLDYRIKAGAKRAPA